MSMDRNNTTQHNTTQHTENATPRTSATQEQQSLAASQQSSDGQCRDVLAVTQGEPGAPRANSQAEDIHNAVAANAPQTCAPPQPLGVVDAALCAMIQTSTGVGVQDVVVEVCPWLETQGKLGAARGGQWIGISPAIQKQPRKVLSHEGIHAVQGRGGSPKKKISRKAQPTRTIEAEAVEGSQAVLSGQPFDVLHIVSSELLFQENGAGEICVEPKQEPIETAEATEPTVEIDPSLLAKASESEGLRKFNEALQAITDKYGPELKLERLRELNPTNFGKHLVLYPSKMDYIACAFAQSEAGVSCESWLKLDGKEREKIYATAYGKISPGQARAEFQYRIDEMHIPNTEDVDVFGHEIFHFLSHNIEDTTKTTKLTFHDLEYFTAHGYSLDLEEAITVYFTAKTFALFAVAEGAGKAMVSTPAGEMDQVKDEFCSAPETTTVSTPSLGIDGVTTVTETTVTKELCGEYYYAYERLQQYLAKGAITEEDLKAYYFQHGPKENILDKLKDNYKHDKTKDSEEIPLGEGQRFGKEKTTLGPTSTPTASSGVTVSGSVKGKDVPAKLVFYINRFKDTPIFRKINQTRDASGNPDGTGRKIVDNPSDSDILRYFPNEFKAYLDREAEKNIKIREEVDLLKGLVDNY